MSHPRAVFFLRHQSQSGAIVVSAQHFSNSRRLPSQIDSKLGNRIAMLVCERRRGQKHRTGGGEWRGGLDWGKRLDYESFYRRRFRAAAEAIGRPTLRFHDLSHTAASLWAASGMPFEMVAAALGHAGTEITYKAYLHFFPDQWARYMDAFLAAPDAQVTPLRRAE